MPKSAASQSEVLFEIKKIGQSARVAAIDAKSGTEVVAVGPAALSTHALQRIALRKLDHVLAKRKRSKPSSSG